MRGNSYRSGLAFDDAELAAIRQPTLCVFGTADKVGSVQTWQHEVATLPHGKLTVLDETAICPGSMLRRVSGPTCGGS